MHVKKESALFSHALFGQSKGDFKGLFKKYSRLIISVNLLNYLLTTNSTDSIKKVNCITNTTREMRSFPLKQQKIAYLNKTLGK